MNCNSWGSDIRLYGLMNLRYRTICLSPVAGGELVGHVKNGDEHEQPAGSE
jgi:hypothetical protein